MSIFNSYDRIKAWSGSFLGLLIMIIVFLTLIFIYYSFSEVFEIDPDEGINLIKGLLVEKGYSLYSDIWSDQPPIFTYFLAIVIRIFGYNVTASRILVLLFSIALLIGFFGYLCMVWGNKHAVAVTLILILLPTYMGLSVSVMIGLPAIAMAVLSLLAQATWHQQRNYIWLILSAIFLCLSVFTKLFTAVLVPVFVAGLLVDEYRRVDTCRRRLRPTLIWVIIFTGLATIIGLVLIGPQNVWQMMLPHIAANEVQYYKHDLASYSINSHLRGAWPILLLAIIGGLFVLQKRRWLSLYPIAWVFLGYIFLSLNTPARNHHQLLVTIPAAMLAGIAIGEVTSMIPVLIKSRNILSYKAMLSAIVLISLAFILMVRIPWISQHSDKFREISEPQIRFIQKMYKYTPKTNWVITDRP
ncbi:MAG: glycosyltransferase family 39 protein, partial [Anaerolineales bacterium]